MAVNSGIKAQVQPKKKHKNQHEGQNLSLQSVAYVPCACGSSAILLHYYLCVAGIIKTRGAVTGSH